ncbi:MAG: NADH-quinone oxidoreductase subunit NuoE [Paludibacter sp.]|nr:NADH-quinone oxidoreductase subunit NuoE [Paludibacter sp.]MDD4427476.1 NADH-quinone oxidoreductase subunit NuoE [Paludibacter sp.]
MIIDTHLSETAEVLIKSICTRYKHDEHELINVLHEIQHHLGYLPEDVQQAIANELKIPVAKVYGVVTFYSFFTMIPKGKYNISICLGTACYVRGGELILEEFKRRLNIGVGETSADGLFSLNSIRCVGACGLAPVVTVGNKVYGRVTPQQVRRIIDEYIKIEEELEIAP